MNYKKLIIGTVITASLLLSASPAFAHVSIRPKEVGVGVYQVFSVGVPVEKDSPTTEVRLVIPEGLHSVMPNVKPGWEIEVKTKGEGENAKVTEIIWSGGSIPPGQRDDFLFSAQAPAKESTVVWKAYQTYEDGSVVAWDQNPQKEDAHSGDFSEKGPYSETKIINDLAPSAKNENVKVESAAGNLPLILGVVAVALAGAAFWKRKK